MSTPLRHCGQCGAPWSFTHTCAGITGAAGMAPSVLTPGIVGALQSYPPGYQPYPDSVAQPVAQPLASVGWVCPLCHRGKAPFTSTCDCRGQSFNRLTPT